jgi:flagellar protein FlaF
MNAYAANKAYANTDKTGGSLRALEGRAFAKAAQMLNDASIGSHTDMRHALEFNLRLWTLVQASVTHPDSPLPDDVRGKLLSLSMFVDRATQRVCETKNHAFAGAMIDVNRSIASAQFQQI